MENLYTVSKNNLGADCGSDQELLIAKFRLKLKKVGKTTRPFGYDVNQIPYDYTVEVLYIVVYICQSQSPNSSHLHLPPLVSSSVSLFAEMATHSSILAWRIPGTEEPGGCRLWGRTESDTTDST